MKGGFRVPQDLVEFKTTAEAAVDDTLKAVQDYETHMQVLCREIGEQAASNVLTEDVKTKIGDEIASLQRASGKLAVSQLKVSAMKDELSARLHDVEASVDRKWYKANPPSNTYIDLAETENQHFAQGINHYKIFIVLFIGSFVGVIIELLWCFLRNGYLESRSGLVYGPFNMLYGIGAAAITIALYPCRNHGRWLSFLGGFTVGSVVEYLCSWFMETAYGAVSWDYSILPFNLNGRICLLYSIFWGFLGVFWIKDLYPRMAKWILKIPNKKGKCLAWFMILFLVWNCAVSAAAVWRWSERGKGHSAESHFEIMLDQRFPDERMQFVYANMSFPEP